MLSSSTIRLETKQMGDDGSTPINSSSNKGFTKEELDVQVICAIMLVIEPFLENLSPRKSTDNHVGPEGNGNSSNGSTIMVSVSKAELELRVIPIIECVMPLFADWVREVIKEKIPSVVETIWTRMNQNSGDRVHSSEPRNLELRFLNKLSLPVLTGRNIKGEDGSSIKIALIDVVTGDVVKSGPESSAKVEIFVLRLDPEGDEGHDWTPEEFKLNIVTESKENLRKNASVKLKEGMGSVGEIAFPHGSIWTKKCEFRLGARIVGTFNGTRVREAKSEPFTLEDCRNKHYEKHDLPSLSDEVWRLRHIDRSGSRVKCLHEESIKTVQDFLKSFSLDRGRAPR